MDYDKMKLQLILHESLKLLPYDDKTGKEVLSGQVLHGKMTIGIGHNLSENGISLVTAGNIYAENIAAMLAAVLKKWPWWIQLNDVRQRVMLDMAFNMGIIGLSKFHNTLEAIRTGNWEAAARGMENSLWYRQVGSRSVRLTKMMRLGIDPPEILAL